MIYVVTTVGISIFENLFKEPGRELPKYLDYLDNNSEKNPSKEKRSCFSKGWEAARKNIIGKNNDSRWRRKIVDAFGGKAVSDGLSAEITSIREITAKFSGQTLCIHLVASDTVLSVAAAVFIKEWFNQEKVRKAYPEIEEVHFEIPKFPFKEQGNERHVAKDLNVEDDNDFQKGFIHLFEILDGINQEIWEKNRDTKNSKRHSMILNITGGYKAIAPVLTMYGQLYKIPVKYIYDENKLTNAQLITLGSLPFNFDWDVVEALTDILNEKEIETLNRESGTLRDDLLKLNLCREEKNGEIKPTVITELLKRYVNYASAMNRGILGAYLEYQLYYYFSQQNSGEAYGNPQKLKSNKLFYSVEEQAFKENQAKGYHEVGDIDLMLTLLGKDDRNDQKALCEVKALSSFKRYLEEKEAEKNYFDRQIKPRIIFYNNRHKIAEFHFYVYKTTFRGVHGKLGEDQKLLELVRYFDQRMQGDEMTKHVRLRIRGFHVDLRKEGLNINYSDLLGKPFDQIDWEDIYQGNLPTSQK